MLKATKGTCNDWMQWTLLNLLKGNRAMESPYISVTVKTDLHTAHTAKIGPDYFTSVTLTWSRHLQ